MKFETNTSLSADRLVDIAFPISGDTTAFPIHVRTAIDTNFSFGAGNGRDGVIFSGTGSGFTYGADGFVDSGNLDSYTYGHSQKLTGGPVINSEIAISEIGATIEETAQEGFWRSLLDGDDVIEFYSTPQKDPFIGGKTIQSGSGDDIVTDLSAQTTLTRGFRTVNSVDLGEGNDQLHLNYNTSNFIITLGDGADTIVQQARQDPDDVVGLRIIKDFNPAQDTIELPDNATGAMIYELVSAEAGTMLKSAGDNPTDILLLEGVALDEVQMKGGIISGHGVENPGKDCDTDSADAVAGEENAPWYGADDDQDVIMGSEGDNELCGSESDEQIFGGDGDDSLFGGGSDTEDECQPSGNDSLHGENGNDYLAAGDGDDYLFGDAGDDILHGGKGDDNLCGGDGNDDLIGHQGSDIIVGGPGNDFFAAGLGDDVIVTGEGSDYYLLQSDGYGTSYGNDIITDFDTGNDLVIIEDDTLHGDNIADCFREIGEGLLVETGNSSVLLQGICADDVDLASNFAF